jgi:hypothetical protein
MKDELTIEIDGDPTTGFSLYFVEMDMSIYPAKTVREIWFIDKTGGSPRGSKLLATLRP